MAIEVGKFVTSVIAITVAVIVIAVVAVPIISENLLPTTGDDAIENAGTINTILTIIPVFLVIAVLIAAIGMFVKNKQ